MFISVIKSTAEQVEMNHLYIYDSSLRQNGAMRNSASIHFTYGRCLQTGSEAVAQTGNRRSKHYTSH